jgi:drug/metabolite transporter (DMT)-like permease
MYLSAARSDAPATRIIPPLYTHNGFMGQSGRYDESWSSLIGIITAIVGNVLISFALNTQRYAHIKLDREWQEKERQRKRRIASSASLSRLADDGAAGKGGSGSGRQSTEEDPLIHHDASSPEASLERVGTDEAAYKQKSYLKSPYWWLGIVLMTIGEAGNFLAYGFAPASIVSPLGVVALISNCIIAPFMLKERFRWRDVAGVVVAVGGAVTVVLSASDNNPKLGPDEIWELIKRWEFETYLGITVGVIIVLMIASNKYGERNILIDLGLVGLFGGFTALSTKGVASLLSYTLWRVITFPVFYLLVAILIGTAVMQIKYINRALQRFDATQVIPVQFVMFTLSVILGSAILYRDFERTSGDDAGKFVGGCALTFSGVWLITSGRPRRSVDEDDDEDDREPEPEDAINLHGERYRDSIDSTSSSHSSSSTIRPPSPPLDILEINPLYQDDSRPSTPTIKVTTPDPSTPPRRTYTSEALDSLTQNPWSQPPDRDSSSPKPGFSRHTSTPVLPSEAAPPASNPSERANLGAIPSDPTISSAPIPRTPTRGKSHDELPFTPGTSQSNLGPGLRRLRTNERQRGSISGPLLASPLSTSLSALVQDRKRGGSVRMRTGENNGDGRRQSVLGLGAGESAEDMFGEPLSRRSTQGMGAERGNEGPSGRGRGMSGTLNELWRGLRGQSSREDIGGEQGQQREGGESSEGR